MTDSSSPLPEFSAPPVVEVLVGIQFEPIEALRGPQIALLWADHFRAKYPIAEEHPPLDPLADQVSLHPSAKFRVQLVDATEAYPAPRWWLLTTSGSELLQIQRDRLIHNWRKVKQGGPYPRYPYMRDTFREEAETLYAFLKDNELGALTINQCEIQYVNHLPSGLGWERHGQASELFDAWGLMPELPEPENVSFGIRYLVPGEVGKPLGRMMVSDDPSFLVENGAPIFRMTIAVIGRPDGDGLEGALRFMDIGREWARRAFAAVTSDRMHQAWGRTR